MSTVLGDTRRENRELRQRVEALESLLRQAVEALAPLKAALPADTSPNWRDDLATWQRVAVDHIVTGLAHPVEAVRTQARALQTELDCAGLNVDAAVKSAQASAS